MSHTVEILSVGTELLLGNIVNSDAQALSRELSGLGLNVLYHSVVGDNPERLRAAVELARSRADVLITTGGLGPTCDDLTKQTLSEAFGKPSRVRPAHPVLFRPIGPGDDGKQPPAGIPPRGLHGAGQRLGHRPRLCL